MTKAPSIQTLETTLATFDAKLAALGDVEREATRALAADPSEAHADRVRRARADVEAWRAARDVAQAQLDALRAEASSAERAKQLDELRQLEKRASRAGFASAAAPALAQLVDAARAVEAAIDALSEVLHAQRRDAVHAQQIALETGADTTARPFEGRDALALAVLATHDAGIRPSTPAWLWRRDDAEAVGQRVLEILDAGGLSIAGYTQMEQARDLLRGVDIHARFRPSPVAST